MTKDDRAVTTYRARSVHNAAMKLTSLVVFLLAASLACAADRAAEMKLQQAIDLMETKGDVPAALKAFEKAAASPDRNIAARALLYIGACHQKLGDQKAGGIWQRLVHDFADQKEIAAEANVRLASLRAKSAASSGMVARQVWTGPDVDALGTVSRDGHYVSFVDWNTGDLALRDLTTGRNRHLTKKGTWVDSDEFAEESAVSPDGRHVAYSWFNKKDEYELRLIGSEGVENGAAERTLYRDDDSTWMMPADWTPDGRSLVVLLARKDHTNQLLLVSVATGAAKVLRRFGPSRFPGVIKYCVSPDGRFIAYDAPSHSDSDESDIFLLPIDGGNEIPLVVHPATESVMGWSPDGRYLLFASDRSGNRGIWRLPIAEGKAQGQPRLIKPDIGRSWYMGVTNTGSLYFSVFAAGEDVYLASINLETGEVLSPPTAFAQQYVGWNNQPDWSPDGKMLVYRTNRGPVPGRGVSMLIRSTETGQVRELQPKLRRAIFPRWSPDNRSLAVQGQDFHSRSGMFRVDAQSGEATPLKVADPKYSMRRSSWSPDGKRVYFYSRSQQGAEDLLMELDLETGRERTLVQSKGATTAAASPDGRWLAFTRLSRESRSSRLEVMPAAGGESRVLFESGEAAPIAPATLNWSPDSKFLLFKRNGDPAAGHNAELLRVSLSDGTVKKMALKADDIRYMSLHPDGRQIAYSGGDIRTELWVLENFLATR